MFSKTLVAIATFAAIVSAQDYPMPTDSAAPTGSVAVHVVKAFNSPQGQPRFEPNEIQANVGDLVQFQFWPQNHSVVQASFADPCIPLEQSSSANGTEGFYSGFMPVAAGSNIMPTFTIEVMNTKPIWFYCSQGRHCQSGMVGAINPTTEKTLSDFTSRAAQAAQNISPGQEDVGDGAAPSGATGDVTVAPTGASPTTMETSVMTGTATGGQSISTGAAPRSVAVSASGLSLVLGVFASFFLL